MFQIAHRGYSELHKDNSLEAFRAAVNHGFHMIELDIVLTKDNIIIVYHDTFIGNDLIRNLKYKEVLSIDPYILTLEDFFFYINYDKIGIYIDIKGNDEHICIYLHKLLRKLRSTENIILGSFNTLILQRLYDYDIDYKLGLITENVLSPTVLQKYNDMYNLRFVSFHWTALNHIIVKFLKLKNIMVFTYTCKNDSIKSFMEEYVPDGIVTNYKLQNNSSMN